MGKDAAEKNGKAAVKAETHAKEPKAGKAAKGEK